MWEIYKYFDNGYIWEARGTGNTDAEVVNQSKTVEIKFPNDASRTWFHLISIVDLELSVLSWTCKPAELFLLALLVKDNYSINTFQLWKK